MAALEVPSGVSGLMVALKTKGFRGGQRDEAAMGGPCSRVSGFFVFFFRKNEKTGFFIEN